MKRSPRRLARTVAACLLAAAGCAGVHQRQALYPNGEKRVVDGRKDSRTAGRPRAPHVEIRVESDPDSTAKRGEGD